MENNVRGIILLVEDDVELGLDKYLEHKSFFVVSRQDSKSAVDEIENGLRYNLMIADRRLKDIEQFVVPPCTIIDSENLMETQVSRRGYSGDWVVETSMRVNPEVPIALISGAWITFSDSSLSLDYRIKGNFKGILYDLGKPLSCQMIDDLIAKVFHK